MTQALLLERKTLDRFRDLKHMIGNTPLLAIHFRYRGGQRVIYAKAEHMNMTGSIKDRMAFHILRKAYSCHVSSPTPRTSKRTRRPPGRRSGGSCTSMPCAPMPLSQASAPAARSWASAVISAGRIRR